MKMHRINPIETEKQSKLIGFSEANPDDKNWTKIERKLKENMKDDDELEMLLGEIPHVIHHQYSINNTHHHHHGNGDHGSNMKIPQKINGMMIMMGGDGTGNGIGVYDDEALNYHKYTCASPASGFSLQSDGSSSSLFSGGHSLSDNGSPTSPPLEEHRPHVLRENSKNFDDLWMDLKAIDSSAGKMGSGSVVDELVLSRNLNKMCISNQQDDVSIGVDGFQSHEQSVEGTFRMSLERSMQSVNYSDGHSGHGGSQSSAPRGVENFDGEMGSPYCYGLGKLSGSEYSPCQSDVHFCPSRDVNRAMSSQFQETIMWSGHGYQMGVPIPESSTTLARPSVMDAVLYAQKRGINLFETRGAVCYPSMAQIAHMRPHFVDNVHFQPAMANGSSVVSHVNIPQRGLEVFAEEDSLIIQEGGQNYVINKGYRRAGGHNSKDFFKEASVQRHQEKRLQSENSSQIAGIQENGRSARMHCAFPLPAKCSSLAEAQGYIYFMAKDQQGCRFLQRMLDEGTSKDVRIIFSEVIDHAIELMMNPFGNYQMQKLLEVCNEEQRMQILLKVTREPGELVRISLNTHGTRVVQKLIETLKTRHQISLVISALEPEFLALIKDLNGNHVVQRCLQCLSNDDNKFIFVAAAKYCVDIATHQHGCCVLQRCISYSTGAHRETLVAKISANGLMLAQDAFGNYVVQFILELKIPSATSKLVSQFEGSYMHLSTQKFSSHVVEKCLLVCNDNIRSKIIRELLSATHFEQLLQDPHANYVVQTALRVCEGPLHNSLVEAIETQRAVSRNSPYSKRIFSNKLLKK